VREITQLSPKEAEWIPWQQFCIDIIGLYAIGPKEKPVYTLHCLTMIDPATGWFEIVPIPSKDSGDIDNLFEQTWLSQYPWPVLDSPLMVGNPGDTYSSEVQTSPTGSL
jgi:hypothetical protein